MEVANWGDPALTRVDLTVVPSLTPTAHASGRVDAPGVIGGARWACSLPSWGYQNANTLAMLRASVFKSSY